MSKLGQSIIDTPAEQALDEAYTLEPDMTEQDIAEAHKAHARWEAITTLKGIAWYVELSAFNAVIISDTKPTFQEAIAALITQGMARPAIELDIAIKRVTLVDIDDHELQNNHIPF